MLFLAEEKAGDTVPKWGATPLPPCCPRHTLLVAVVGQTRKKTSLRRVSFYFILLRQVCNSVFEL